jgi:sugar lactone lactonase YvrE
MDELEALPCSEERADLGESCRWDGVRGQLLWVDIFEGRMYCTQPNGDRLILTQRYDVPAHLTAVAPIDGAGAGWIVAANQGIGHLREDGRLTWLTHPEERNGGRVRMNDGACDPQGRFWVGSMDYNAVPGAGTLYRYGLDGDLTTVLTGVTISNGIGWSPDGRSMYYTDSGPGTVTVHDYEAATGDITNGRALLQFDPAREGVPDGLCVDAEGCLWIAVWGGGQVRRYSPQRELIARVTLQSTQPTSCAIGGLSGTDLYITTARVGLSDEQLAREPDAGRVFRVDVGVAAPPSQPYRGSLPW